MNTWMLAQYSWTPRTLGSKLSVGITIAITTINPIILNYNLDRASWWVGWCARLEQQGEWCGNLGSKPSLVKIDTLTRRVELWSKATGTRSLWSSYCSLKCKVESYHLSCGWAILERRRMTWKVIWIEWSLMPVRLGSSMMELGEETPVWSKYSAGI